MGLEFAIGVFDCDCQKTINAAAVSLWELVRISSCTKTDGSEKSTGRCRAAAV
ncbi:MAG: hypothetical protein IJ055_02740 [Oscillospiraceae bacterium]|nr:hypothetical protein [Oscillospiraceae bacterium]